MLDSSRCRMLITCNKCDGHRLTFTGGACVSLQVFGRVWTLYMCVKTIKAVTAMSACLFNKWSSSYMHGVVWQLSGKQTSGKNTAGLCWHECHRPLAMLQCTGHLHSAHAAASLYHSLLLSRDDRNWSTVLGGSRRADCRPSQWRLHNGFTSPAACGERAAMRYWCL